MKYTREKLAEILEEIAGFEVELADDPTLPSLGTKYLNGRIALCRRYLNRVIYYMQMIGKQVKDLNIEVRQMELDLDLKMAQKLTDDPSVKRGPSIEDRKALATTLLKEENDSLKTLRLELLDVIETMKIVRMKHQDLIRTNVDIRSQRQLIKDDMDAQLSGRDGYGRPQTKKDGSVPNGMPPPVSEKIDPQDLLDPNKRPEDMPEPVDMMHAQQIADFFNSKVTVHAQQVADFLDSKVTDTKTESQDEDKATAGVMSFEDMLI